MRTIPIPQGHHDVVQNGADAILCPDYRADQNIANAHWGNVRRRRRFSSNPSNI